MVVAAQRCHHGGGASVAAHKRRRQENRRWSVVVLSQLQRQRRKQQSNWQLAKQAPDELRREVVLPRRDENHRSKLACTQRRQPHHCAPPSLVDKRGKPSVRPSAAFEVSKRGMVLTIWRLCKRCAPACRVFLVRRACRSHAGESKREVGGGKGATACCCRRGALLVATIMAMVDNEDYYYTLLLR